jgi:hypothetical protein
MSFDIKEFDDLLNFGSVSHSINVAGHEIALRTLTGKEHQDAMRSVPDAGSTTESERLDVIQREIVAAALQSIDGKRLSQEEKSELLKAGQLGLSNVLYVEYIQMIDEQQKRLDTVKKTSLKDETPLKESLTVPSSK